MELDLLLFFLHVYVLPLPGTASSLETGSHSLQPHPGLVEHIVSLFKFLWTSNDWISSHVTLSPATPLKTIIIFVFYCVFLGGANPIFSSFPSVFFSCSSTWRSVTWGCHEDKLTAECPPPHSKKVVQLQITPDEENESRILLLGCVIMGFLCWGQGRVRAGNIYAKGENRVVSKVRNCSQSKNENDEDIQSRKWVTACLKMCSH